MNQAIRKVEFSIIFSLSGRRRPFNLDFPEAPLPTKQNIIQMKGERLRLNFLLLLFARARVLFESLFAFHPDHVSYKQLQ